MGDIQYEYNYDISRALWCIDHILAAICEDITPRADSVLPKLNFPNFSMDLNTTSLNLEERSEWILECRPPSAVIAIHLFH